MGTLCFWNGQQKDQNINDKFEAPQGLPSCREVNLQGRRKAQANRQTEREKRATEAAEGSAPIERQREVRATGVAEGSAPIDRETERREREMQGVLGRVVRIGTALRWFALPSWFA